MNNSKNKLVKDINKIYNRLRDKQRYISFLKSMLPYTKQELAIMYKQFKKNINITLEEEKEIHESENILNTNIDININYNELKEVEQIEEIKEKIENVINYTEVINVDKLNKVLKDELIINKEIIFKEIIDLDVDEVFSDNFDLEELTKLSKNIEQKQPQLEQEILELVENKNDNKEEDKIKEVELENKIESNKIIEDLKKTIENKEKDIEILIKKNNNELLLIREDYNKMKVENINLRNIILYKDKIINDKNNEISAAINKARLMMFSDDNLFNKLNDLKMNLNNQIRFYEDQILATKDQELRKQLHSKRGMVIVNRDSIDSIINRLKNILNVKSN